MKNKVLAFCFLSLVLVNLYGVIGMGYSEVFQLTEETLLSPVLLQAFTALDNEQGRVTLQWTTAREVDLIEFRLHRSTGTDLSDATLITPTGIQATNTLSIKEYSFEDPETHQPGILYYWLEIVDPFGTEFAGPQSVTIQDVPTLPEVTMMHSPYPNPFKSGIASNIKIEVKEGETATFSIYDLRGRLIKQFRLQPGIHPLAWDGKDSNGAMCGSGIYLIRLDSKSKTSTAKVVLLK